MSSSRAVPGEAELFRAMRADGDVPKIGMSAVSLGARLNKDIAEQADGNVYPGAGGMSVVPNDPSFLPVWTVSDLRAGRLAVFAISTRDLGPNLGYRPDPGNPERHGFVEPARPMPFDDYLRLLWSTGDRWRRA